MGIRVPAAVCLTVALSLLSGGAALADQSVVQESVTLQPGSSTIYTLDGSSGGSLAVELTDGDVDISLQDANLNTVVQSTLSGTGTSTVSLSPLANPLTLALSSSQGADLSFQFTPGFSTSSSQVTSTSVIGGQVSISSSSSSSTVSSNISTNSSGLTSVTSGGSLSLQQDGVVAGGGSGGRIEIRNGQVIVTGGQ